MHYQPLPLELVASLPELPFPVYLQRDGRMVLYAMPGADLGAALGRAKVGLQVHVPATDAAAMRRLLVVLFARALEARSDPVADRGRRAVDFAVALLSPLFGRERSIDAEAFVAGQAAVDLLSAALALEPALGRAIVGGHRSRHVTARPGTQDGPTGAPAGPQRSAARALDGLACAIALSGALAPDGSGLDGLTLLEVGRGVAFRDLGLPRAVPEARRPAQPARVGAPADRGHPWLGVRLIAEALGSQPAWASLVGGHHERMDGSGYPAGRHGAELPRSLRVAGLADTFAALVGPAAWGNVRAADEAIGVLRLGARARFGDDLVLALVKVLEAGQLLPLRRAGIAPTTH